VEKNRLVRELVIRKSRGTPLTIAKVPFAITERGLKVWAPPSLETIPALNTSKAFKFPCEILQKSIGPIYGGMITYVSYPVDARPYHVMPILMGLSIYNNAKTLIITYTYSPEQILEILVESFLRLVTSDKRLLSLLKKRMGEIFIIKGFNPSAYSVEELYAQEMMLISSTKPDIVVFFGVDALSKVNRGELLDLLLNQALYLKSTGALTFRLGSYSSEITYAENARISDAVVRFSYGVGSPGYRGKGGLSMYIWITGLDPVVLNYEQISRCRMETMMEIKRILLEGGN
jgi:hypothetical protein